MQIPNPYNKPYYKFYILIALAIFILAALAIPNLKPGIDLTGGTAMMMSIPQEISTDQIKLLLSEKGIDDSNVKITANPLTGRQGLIIEFTGHRDLLEARAMIDQNPEQARALASQFIPKDPGNLTISQYVQLAEENFKLQLREEIAQKVGIVSNDISMSSVGASIGAMFWETSQRALIIAFILIAAIVFVLFRQLVPSIAVIQAILFDVVIALAGMTLIGIPITLPTIVALLMIIGYSVDSDIMLTDRIMRRKHGSTAERAYSAMKTGLTMTGTTLTVLLVLLVFSHFSQMVALFQITGVLFFGLLGDIPATYLVNVVVVKWWMDKQETS
ncbi:hypothetical protein K8R43_00170 [archaeon]|nr:hypothetical protein [archaeon]